MCYKHLSLTIVNIIIDGKGFRGFFFRDLRTYSCIYVEMYLDKEIKKNLCHFIFGVTDFGIRFD